MIDEELKESETHTEEANNQDEAVEVVTEVAGASEQTEE